MNSEIQQLAEQAKKSVPAGILQVDKWIETYNEKLGELVVRKCAEIADTAEPYKANDLILKHFGIK